MGASETKPTKIHDDAVLSELDMGKTLTVLSSMQVPKSGQGVVNHGLKRLYFEKKYLVLGILHVNTSHDLDNTCKADILRKLNVRHDSQPHQRLLVLCDKISDMAKLPDPDYIVGLDTLKFITMTHMKACLSKTHCTLI